MVLAIVAATSMATIGVFSRFSYLPAEQVTFFRLFVGAFVLGLLILLRRKSLILRSSDFVQCSLLGGCLAGFILFYIESMNWTLMANAIVFVYLAPVLSTAFGWVVGKEPMVKSQVILIVLALFGFALMQHDFSMSDWNRGTGYALLAMLCYSGFIILNRNLSQRVDSTVGAFWQLSMGSLVVLPVCLIRNLSWGLTNDQWWLMLAVGLLPGFIALYAAILALKKLTTSVYGTIAYLEPATVAFFGWLFFAEKLTAIQLLGGCLIIVAGILQSLVSGTHHRARLNSR